MNNFILEMLEIEFKNDEKRKNEQEQIEKIEKEKKMKEELEKNKEEKERIEKNKILLMLREEENRKIREDKEIKRKLEEEKNLLKQNEKINENLLLKERELKNEEILEIIKGKQENKYVVDDTYNVYGEKINYLTEILTFIKDKNVKLFNYIKKVDKLGRYKKKITYKPSLRPTIGKVKYTISYVEDSRNTKYLNRIETQNMVIDEDNVELYLEDYYRRFKK